MPMNQMPMGQKPAPAPEKEQDVYYLPQECFGGKAEVGSTVTMKVVEAPDEQGQVGVAVEGGGEPMDETEMDETGKAAFGETD